MEKELVFSIISVALFMIAFIPYLRDVLAGKTLPHPYSQLVWTIVFFISTSVLLYKGEYIGSIPGIVAVIANCIWCFYGFKSYGKLPINWFDKICLVLAILALLYGIVTQDFFNTIILVIGIDLLAFLPTLKKGWLLPWTDTIISWLLSSFQYIFMLLALTHLSLETAGFWFYNIIITLFFFFVVFFRRWYLKGWNSIFE